MEVWSAGAATVAAIAAVLGLIQHRRAARRRQLEETMDLLEELRAVVSWGGGQRPSDLLQSLVRARIHGRDLPKTEAVARSELKSFVSVVDRIDEALAEVRHRLGRGSE